MPLVVLRLPLAFTRGPTGRKCEPFGQDRVYQNTFIETDSNMSHDHGNGQ
jgi:hypothetical protein